MIYSKQDIITKKCFSCNQKEHPITCCPLLTLNLNKEKVIEKYIKNSNFQRRGSFSRNKNKIHVKSNFSSFKQNSDKFIFENEILCNFSFNFH